MSSDRSSTRGAGRRVSSIARSISMSYWLRRLVQWIFFDLLAACIALGLFIHACNQTLPPALMSPGAIFPNCDFGLYGGRAIAAWHYGVHAPDGTVYSFYLLDAARSIWPLPVFVILWELIDLLRIFSETRRVRRKLQPLQDLALTAEAVGQAAAADPMAADPLAADVDKMAMLEQAIARAGVDSPIISTGNQDLRPIEVALNRLLRQMQEAKLQQMRFVNDASHELRTPIAVIQGYVNMLDRWGKTDETVLDESIEALKQESDHMQELVEQLLFLARGDSGRNTLQRTKVNLAAVVHEVWEESCMIDAKHVYRCTVADADTADPRFTVEGDLALIKQSLRIIVQNAEKYSADGSAITLSAAAEGAHAGFSVQDEGIGMSQEDAAHAFERFYRASGARNETNEGSGLGLSIAKWIVDAHGGTIDVVSREGVGTRFTVSLPKTAA